MPIPHSQDGTGHVGPFSNGEKGWNYALTPDGPNQTYAFKDNFNMFGTEWSEPVRLSGAVQQLELVPKATIGNWELRVLL